MFGKYCFSNLFQEAYKNKEKLIAHVKGQNIECFNDDKIIGMSMTVFIIIFVISFIPWFIAVYLLFTRFHQLETWAIIVAVLGLVTGLGSLVSIVAILIGEKSTSKVTKVTKFKLGSGVPSKATVFRAKNGSTTKNHVNGKAKNGSATKNHVNGKAKNGSATKNHVNGKAKNGKAKNGSATKNHVVKSRANNSRRPDIYRMINGNF
jgi:hypothetical protein